MNFVTVDQLEVGDLVDAKVRTPLYLVIKIGDGETILANHLETLTVNSGYFGLISRKPEMRIVQNGKSRVSHIVVSNKSLCGARNTGVSRTVSQVTCEKCQEQMKAFEMAFPKPIVNLKANGHISSVSDQLDYQFAASTGCPMF